MVSRKKYEVFPFLSSLFKPEQFIFFSLLLLTRIVTSYVHVYVSMLPKLTFVYIALKKSHSIRFLHKYDIFLTVHVARPRGKGDEHNHKDRGERAIPAHLQPNIGQHILPVIVQVYNLYPL